MESRRRHGCQNVEGNFYTSCTLYKHIWKWLAIPFTVVCVPCARCSRMEESTQGSSSQSKSALVLSPAALLVKGGQYGELVLSTQLLAQRRRGREELVCGTFSALTDRQTDTTVLLRLGQCGLEEGRYRGVGGAQQHKLPIKMKEIVCSEPHSETGLEVEPETEGIQVTGHTWTCKVHEVRVKYCCCIHSLVKVHGWKLLKHQNVVKLCD